MKTKIPPYPHDFQIHSNFSDGADELETIVEAAVKNGLRSICITDHAKGWTEKGGMIEFFEYANNFKDYLSRIAALRRKYTDMGVEILTGLEVEVTIDGRLRLGDGILAVIGHEEKLKDYIDIVVGVIHSESFEEDLQAYVAVDVKIKESLHMKNIQNLLSHKSIDIWGHPLQSMHGQFLRQYNIQEIQLIKKALIERGDLAIEINLNPKPNYEQWHELGDLYTQGLNVFDTAIYEAVADVCTIVVSSDAHTTEQLNRHQDLKDNPANKYVRCYV